MWVKDSSIRDQISVYGILAFKNLKKNIIMLTILSGCLFGYNFWVVFNYT